MDKLLIPFLFLSLSAYAIRIDYLGNDGNLLVTWETPTTYENGDQLPFNNIGGYALFWSDQPDGEGVRINIDKHLTQYTLTNVPEGDNYFAMLTYDQNGTDGNLSDVVYYNFDINQISAPISPPVSKTFLFMPIDGSYTYNFTVTVYNGQITVFRQTCLGVGTLCGRIKQLK